MYFYSVLVLLLIWLPTSSLAHNHEPITPLTLIKELEQNKVNLGRSLFFDPRLSKNNLLHCASCHQLSTNGADQKARSIGVHGDNAELKTPTVYNVAFNIKQTWSGAAENLIEQIDAPIHNPKEHDTNWEEVLTKLKQDTSLLERFSTVYSNGLSAENIKDAIAEFEKSLVTLNSPFDQFLHGDSNAITSNQKQGYALFKSYGCISCHQGKNVGGNMFAKFGAFGNYFADRGTHITQADLGRYNHTKNALDKHVFKVPSLRLVTLQTHFFHDASHSDLSDAISTMAKYQLGRDIPQEDIDKIKDFLGSLVGQHKELLHHHEK